MQTYSGESVSITVIIIYGAIILLYLLILQLLLNVLQQLSDKHRPQRSVIDVDIHRTMTPRIESSMHTFDISSVALIIAKAGISVAAMAAVIVLLVIKIGILASITLVAIVILVAWAIDVWLKSRKTSNSVRSEVRKVVQKSGNIGVMLALSILLAVLLFIMITI